MTTDPTAARPAWSAPLDIDGVNFVGGISCPSTLLCVAVDSSGRVIVGHGSVPTAAQIKKALRRAMTPGGKPARIETLLKHTGRPVSVSALGAGKVIIDWYYAPKGAHVSHGKPKHYTITPASGEHRGLGSGDSMPIRRLCDATSWSSDAGATNDMAQIGSHRSRQDAARDHRGRAC